MTTPTIEDDIAALSAAIDAETTLVYIGQEMRDSIARLIAALQEALEELSQPARVGLTEAEIEAIAIEHEDFGFCRIDNGISTHGFNPEGLMAFARAIERAHNIPAAQEGE